MENKTANPCEKIYNLNKLRKKTDIASNVLNLWFGLNEKEWGNLLNNFYDIVDYVTDKKEISRKDHKAVAKVMQIAYCEYMDFLVEVLTRDSRLRNQEYRNEHTIVRPFNSEMKTYILEKYLKTYNEYESSFR